MHPSRPILTTYSSLIGKPTRLYTIALIVLVVITILWPFLATQSFADRTLGAFALADVNVNARNALYMLGIGIAFCMLSLLVWLGNASMFSRLRFNSLASSRESPAYLVYALIITNAALYLYARTPVYLVAVQILCILCVANVVLSKLLARGSTLADRVWILGLSYQITISLQLLAKGYAGLDGAFIAGFAILVATLSYSLRRSPTIIHWAYPLVWLPIVPILASELDYLFLRRFSSGADFHTTCAALSGFIVLLSAYRWRCVAAGSSVPETAPSFVFRRYLLPIVLTSRALAEYSAGAVLSGNSYDFFHLGEMVLPVHQTLQYGAIPYIDYYPPHGLFDFLPQAIYSLIFGTQVLESTAWGHGYMIGWLPKLVAGAIFFAFFSRFWGRLPTALLMLFLPTYHLIHPYYSFLLIPGLFIYRLPPVPLRLAPWSHLWLAVLAVGLWRVDFGIASGLGCFSVMLLGAWQQQNWRIALAGATSAIFVVLFLLATFSTVALLRGHSPLVLLVQAIQYVRIQIPVTSYIAFIRQIDLTALLQLVMLPLLGVLALVFTGNKSFFLLRPLNRLEQVLLYLAVISLTMSIRSLHRHTLYVGYFNQYFFVFIGLALLCYLPRKYFKTTMCLTVATIAVSHAFLPKSTSFIHHALYVYETDKQYLLAAHNYQFPRWSKDFEPGDARLDDRVKDRRDGIVNFLQQNLNANQTFYDFTNSPLLYALVDRKAPNYLFETLYHSSDTTQNYVLTELERWRKQHRLPFVLFRYNGLGSMENLDGVNTVLRSYRVAEYIYQNYQPCVRLGDYDVWVEQQAQPSQSCPQLVFNEAASGVQMSSLANASPSQEFDSGFIPLIWAQRDPYCAHCQPLIQHWEFPAQTARIWSLDLAGNSSGRAAYLELAVTAEQDSIVQIHYGDSYISMNVRATDQPQAYVVRLSVLHSWWRDSMQEIKISSDQPIVLNSADLREGD